MCRITVGGSHEKERTYGIQVARHVPRAKRHQDITSMQNSGVHITILYVTRKWIPFTAYVSPISLENRKRCSGHETVQRSITLIELLDA